MSVEFKAARMINLGCGRRIHPDWVNVDIAPRRPEVIRCDLSRGIPYADNAFDVAYHSHVLEHIRRADALPFLRECFRVLKPGGILRVATPDLERICRLYLQKLESAAAGETPHDYDWMLLEMYDQTVRETPGGQMSPFLGQDPLPNEPFVLDRIGQEGREIIDGLRQSRAAETRKKPVWREIIRRPRTMFDILGGTLARLFLGGDAPRALEIGRFRLAGEVHQWMYDRVSLARLLLAAGFGKPVVCAAGESAVAGWAAFRLDTNADRSAVKPDSLFMEAVKPAESPRQR
jgi:predicted SAM-dependent methyltransferase